MNKMSSKAATQLYEIILLLPDESKSKIPLSVMNLLEFKKLDTEEINIKNINDINDAELLDETKKYLSYILLRYLANEEEKNEFIHQIFFGNTYDVSNILRILGII